MNYGNFDIGAFFDNISKAAQDFHRNVRESGGDFGGDGVEKNANDYGAFPYPRANIYKRRDGCFVFEFELTGFSESDIDLSFQGNYMVLSVKPVAGADGNCEVEAETADFYLRRDIQFLPVENRRFFVPAEEYNQEAVKAVFKNGLLSIRIPPQKAPENKNAVHIEIQ
ncbi:MAG: Hsp20/alpha crystallin family protein [Spirochaetaceae bacterium]|jgi:HSP20 family molecular chaperone IbpA|nr:Hsp20/alpha crystallin family protein [Spirochaetaceae bacterium]